MEENGILNGIIVTNGVVWLISIITIPSYLSKNKKTQDITIDESVVDVLKGIERQPGSPYIFCHKDGKRRYDLRKAFTTALKCAKIEPGKTRLLKIKLLFIALGTFSVASLQITA